MKQRRWLWGGLAALLAGGVFAWLAWPGRETPLTTLLPAFLRRDATWQAMQARGTWRVGMDPSFPPFEWLDAAGVPIGYDVELARKLAADWGLMVEIVPIGFDSLLDALLAGKIDAIVSAYPYDARLTRDVAFSTPYFDAGLQLAVPKGSAIGSRAGLQGKRVAVEWGSEGDMIGRQWQREGDEFTLVPLETPQDVIDALGAGSADAILIDSVTLRQAEAAGAALAAAGPHVTSNPYVIAVPRRAFELLEQTNAGLLRLAQSAELAALEQEWFGRQ
jgi:polar amino acid transport system substrate-binding protein